MASQVGAPQRLLTLTQCVHIQAGVGAEGLLEGTGTHKTNQQPCNTEPETKIHDRYHEMCSWDIPRAHL